MSNKETSSSSSNDFTLENKKKDKKGKDNLRKHLRICLQCGSENILHKENTLRCVDCGDKLPY